MWDIDTFVSELEISKEDMDETITTAIETLAGSNNITETLLALATRYNGPDDSLKAVIAGLVVATILKGGSS